MKSHAINLTAKTPRRKAAKNVQNLAQRLRRSSEFLGGLCDLASWRLNDCLLTHSHSRVAHQPSASRHSTSVRWRQVNIGVSLSV